MKMQLSNKKAISLAQWKSKKASTKMTALKALLEKGQLMNNQEIDDHLEEDELFSGMLIW